MNRLKTTRNSGNKLVYILVIVLLFLLALVPYPTRVLSSINLSLADEAVKPIVGSVGKVQYTLYPTIEDKSLKFVFDKQGEASIGEQVLWMCWVKRRFYDVLRIMPRGGWGDPSGTITIAIPHKSIPPGNMRVAELISPKMDVADWSFSPEDRRAGIGYGNTKLKRFWSLETEATTESDNVKLFIKDIREDICSRIELRVNVKTIDKYSSSTGL
jgi:hypothetical protein